MIKIFAAISATFLLVACVKNSANNYYPSTGYSSSQTSPDSVTLQLRNDRGRHYHSGHRDGYSSETSKGYRQRTRRPVNDKNNDIFQGNRQQQSDNSTPSISATTTGPVNGSNPSEDKVKAHEGNDLSARAPMPMEIVKPGDAQ